MDRKMEHRHLEETDEHIARGRKLIAAQEATLAMLRHNGHDTALAETLLENLYLSQTNHIAHRELILRELHP
jgi:hypothetical protein